MLERSGAHRLVWILAAREDRIGAGGVAKVTRDANRRLPHEGVRILEHRQDSIAHRGVADRVQRADGSLSNSGVGVTESGEQRLEGPPIAESCQRGCDDDPEFPLLVVAQQGEKSRRRTGVAHPAERDYGGPPRVDVFSSKLLDQEVNRRTAEAYQRLDDLVPYV